MNDKDNNEELFKQALIEGVNRRIQREIDSCTDYTPSEPIVSKEVWDEAQKIIPREELYKAIEESALRAEQEYYMKVMRVALNITKQKRRKEHGE